MYQLIKGVRGVDSKFLTTSQPAADSIATRQWIFKPCDRRHLQANEGGGTLNNIRFSKILRDRALPNDAPEWVRSEQSDIT